MAYIKPIHDVLGLENRVKLVVSASEQGSEVLAGINDLKLITEDSEYKLSKKPTKSGTVFYCVLKKGATEVTTDDSLSSSTQVGEDELLCKVNVSGLAPDSSASDIFSESSKWSAYGDIRFSIEAKHAEDVKTASFKAENITNVHYQAFRGVRVNAADMSVTTDANVITFPV